MNDDFGNVVIPRRITNRDVHEYRRNIEQPIEELENRAFTAHRRVERRKPGVKLTKKLESKITKRKISDLRDSEQRQEFKRRSKKTTRKPKKSVRKSRKPVKKSPCLKKKKSSCVRSRKCYWSKRSRSKSPCRLNGKRR